jgi:hypothetical protein
VRILEAGRAPKVGSPKCLPNRNACLCVSVMPAPCGGGGCLLGCECLPAGVRQAGGGSFEQACRLSRAGAVAEVGTVAECLPRR